MTILVCMRPIAAMVTAVLFFVGAAAAQVRVWEESRVIPTYLWEPGEPNPIFYTGRSYVAIKGNIYPYPLYDNLTDQRADRTYKAIYLENQYIRLCVIPELGGRIFSGLDKTNGYPFFYEQHVVKPGILSMIGAWTSGGVEWNIPHIHRASGLLPVDYRIVENPDGSKTIWVGELELRHRMRWIVGITLYPDKSYIEATVKLFNRTPLPHTFLAFANAAVPVDENYQVIFPEDVEYGASHGKTQFVSWPVGAENYGEPGDRKVDISWWKNHRTFFSTFAWQSESDFFGGYDHGRQAGLVHIADHELVPGKKFWEWGAGPAGRMWDQILSDTDGPYIELMGGGYTDNQPDYSWIQPHEVKVFRQYWYPVRQLGGFRKANLDAALNLETDAAGVIHFALNTTAEVRGATARIQAGDRTLFEEVADIGPAKPFERQLPLPAGVRREDLRASLNAGGRELIFYQPSKPKASPPPEPVQPPPPPADIRSGDELFLAGQRLDEFYSPVHEPDEYYEELLRRDPGDSRANTALASLYCWRGLFSQAEQRARVAIARLTNNYTQPKDREAYFYLGLALKMQGRFDEAYSSFQKAAYSSAWFAAANFASAEIRAAQGDAPRALELADLSISRNTLDTKALSLKAAMLRRIGRRPEARSAAEAALAVDPLDFWAANELALSAAGSPEGTRLVEELRLRMRDDPQSYLELAIDYGNAGLLDEAIGVLARFADRSRDGQVHPMVHYYLGFYYAGRGDRDRSLKQYKLASRMPADYCFPFRLESIAVLESAMKTNPGDARAPYYLGNLLFDIQPGKAASLWEAAAALDPEFNIVHRNLAVAYAHRTTGSDIGRAILELEKAVSLDPKYARHFTELDELYEQAGTPIEKRYPLFARNRDIVARRDDSQNRFIALSIAMGQYDDAIRMLSERKFAVAEGPNLNLAEHWTEVHLLRGRRRLEAGRVKEALADFETAAAIPTTLPAVEAGSAVATPETAYWIGAAYEALGDSARAAQSFTEATRLSPAGPGGSSFGPEPEFDGRAAGQSYYRALSLRKLGRNDEAHAIFQNLLGFGQKALREPIPQPARRDDDHPQRPPRARLADAHYMLALGSLGLGDRTQAELEFARALETSPDLLGARTALAALRR
jgi:tetratricopeptide (TPR) repeat protein